MFLSTHILSVVEELADVVGVLYEGDPVTEGAPDELTARMKPKKARLEDVFLSVMADEGVTRLCVVPTQYRMFIQTDLDQHDLKFVEALSAGEPLNREPTEAIQDAYGITLRDGYGQIETVALVLNYPGIDVKEGSMGKPTPGLGTTIINTQDEEEVEQGEIGEIAVPVG